MGVHTRWRENPPYFGCWPHTFEFRLAYHYPDIRLGCRLNYCIKSELQLDVSGDKWPFSVVFWLLSPFRPYALIIQIKSLYPCSRFDCESIYDTKSKFQPDVSATLAIFYCFRTFWALFDCIRRYFGSKFRIPGPNWTADQSVASNQSINQQFFFFVCFFAKSVNSWLFWTFHSTLT